MSMCKKLASNLPEICKSCPSLLLAAQASHFGPVVCLYTIENKGETKSPHPPPTCPFGQSIALLSASFNLSADGECYFEESSSTSFALDLGIGICMDHSGPCR